MQIIVLIIGIVIGYFGHNYISEPKVVEVPQKVLAEPSKTTGQKIDQILTIITE